MMGRSGTTRLVDVGVVLVLVLGVLPAVLLGPVATTRKAARQAGCKANLKQMAIGHRKAASNQLRQGLYVPGVANVDGPAGKWFPPQTVWARDGVADGYSGLFRGQGILVDRALITAEVLYCPDWDIESWLPGRIDPATGAGGWVPVTASPKELKSLVSTYYYRSTFGGPPPKWRPAQTADDPDEAALLADAFADKLVDHHHATGYNVAYLDCHVSMVKPSGKNDPRQMAFGQGQALYASLERVFQTSLAIPPAPQTRPASRPESSPAP